MNEIQDLFDSVEECFALALLAGTVVVTAFAAGVTLYFWM